MPLPISIKRRLCIALKRRSEMSERWFSTFSIPSFCRRWWQWSLHRWFMLNPLWTAIVFINHECHKDSRHTYEIRYTLVLVYKQWCQQEIMHKKQQQIDSEMPPHDKHLRPVEPYVRVADRPHIQTQQWDCKEQAPHRQVYYVLKS